MPGWQQDNRRVWKRTAYVKGAAGYNVEIDAISARKQKKRETGIVGMTPSEYGRKCEGLAVKLLKTRGYTATKAHLSRGASDLFAVNDTDTLQVQVKAASSPGRVPAAIHACARDMRGMQSGARKTGIIYLYMKGAIIDIELTASGWIVNAKQPYRDVAEKILAKVATTYLERTKRQRRG